MSRGHELFTTSTLAGIRLHTLKTEKFKTTVIEVRITLPLKKETVTHAALLPHVLKRGSKDYPTETLLRIELDRLYGATLEAETVKKGENQVIIFQLDVANGSYVQAEEQLLAKAFHLLRSLLFNPAMENGAFINRHVEIEKQNLRKRIDSLIDDKIRYANLRTAEEMCKGEPYALSALGYKEDLDQISPESLTRFYQDTMQNAAIDWYVVGEADHEEISRLLQQSLGDLKRGEPKEPVEAEDRRVEEPRVHIEEQDITQGKLHLGFRTHTRIKDEDYIPMLVFNGVYGGYPHSKLFVHVREKESLAYYASSRLESLKGILMVMSGIEAENYDKAKAIMLEQLDEVRRGNISDEELAQTKAVLTGQIREIPDSARGLIEFHHNSLLGQRFRPLEEVIQEIVKVSKEQVAEAAHKVELDLIYFLRNKGGSPHATA